MARRKGGAENTLCTENTVRTRHLIGKVGEAYYANRHRRQDVTPGGARREDIGLASPEQTLKIMMYSKYLFLEIWQSRLLDMPVDEIVEKMGIKEYPSLVDILWQDAETKKFVETMRHQFSAHPYYSLEETVLMIEKFDFERFWRVARRILLFKDAVTVVRYESGSLGCILDKEPEVSFVPSHEAPQAEIEAMKRQYGGPMLDTEWGKDNPRQVMQECLACIQSLKEELEIASSLHQVYRTRQTLERLVGASYDSKFMIMEMHDFIRRYKALNLPIKPGFWDRKSVYRDLRNQYAAHNDDEERITSIMELYGDRELLPTLRRDMDEAILLSRRLFSGHVPGARFRLPSLSRIGEIEEEFKQVHRESHRRLGNRFENGKYERDCAEHRLRVGRKLGLR